MRANTDILQLYYYPYRWPNYYNSNKKQSDNFVAKYSYLPNMFISNVIIIFYRKAGTSSPIKIHLIINHESIKLTPTWRRRNERKFQCKMGPLVYWVLFSVLVALLVIFLSYFVFSIIVDVCLVDAEGSDKQASEGEDNCRLNKYYFDRHDVEDLTRIQGNFKTVLPNLTLTNEVERSNVDCLLKKKNHRYSSLSNIDEEDGSKRSLDYLNSTSSIHSIVSEENVQYTPEGNTKISQSVDDLEFCDPMGIDVLKEFHKIEEEAKKIDKDLDYFIGSTSDVKYYEINEALLRLMISLCDISFESDELRKKKSETLEYIEECQRKLKAKVK